MEKVIRDGMVAVVYCPSFGCYWYTRKREPALMYHPKLVAKIESCLRHHITDEWVEKELGVKNQRVFEPNSLEIRWLKRGTVFRVNEYDGCETIVTQEEDELFTA
jgi:hypothetical protein